MAKRTADEINRKLSTTTYGKTKRLSLDVDVDTHRRLKIKAAQTGVTMSDYIRSLIIATLEDDAYSLTNIKNGGV